MHLFAAFVLICEFNFKCGRIGSNGFTSRYGQGNIRNKVNTMNETKQTPLHRQNYIDIIAPAIGSAEQLEQMFLDIEAAFDGVLSGKLMCPLCDKIPKHTKTRLDLIRSRLANKTKRQASLGDEGMNVYFCFSAPPYPLGKTGLPYLIMSLAINWELVDWGTDKWMTIVSMLCEQANAHFGRFTPGDDYFDLVNILRRNRFANEDKSTSHYGYLMEEIEGLLARYPELSGLPDMELAGYAYEVTDVRIVSEIAWINYWSKDVCEFNTFPDVSLAFDKSIRYTQTPSGGYVWALTPEPWTLGEEAHRQQMLLAYKRFPKVGVKMELP